MSESYHNTTHSSGPQLGLFEAKDGNQEAAIFNFYRHHWKHGFTPSEVWARLFDGSVPLTSVRRAISNLTERRLLHKTMTQRNGPYGRPEYVWRYNFSERKAA